VQHSELAHWPVWPSLKSRANLLTPQGLQESPRNVQAPWRLKECSPTGRIIDVTVLHSHTMIRRIEAREIIVEDEIRERDSYRSLNTFDEVQTTDRQEEDLARIQ